MVIVDTTVWIDYLGGIHNSQTAWLDREISHQRLGLTDIIPCEVLQGVRREAAFAQVRNDLSKFPTALR
jgi:predicted nucleic acid-binding protein